MTSEHSTRGGSLQIPLDVEDLDSRGQGSRASLTMTTSPGIGVGSRSRNRTFSSLTGTSNARLSAEMVSSAGLLWDRALSTAASVCRQGPVPPLTYPLETHYQPSRPGQNSLSSSHQGFYIPSAPTQLHSSLHSFLASLS